MSTEKTEALVIRQADFSESSRVVTFFTRDFGKISTVAKGAKRLKSAFEVALDLLTVCTIVFIRKSTSGLDILTEAQLRLRFHPQPGNLTSLYGGYYVAELLAGLTEEYDPHPQLYAEALTTLERLSSGAQASLCLAHFELLILREIGQLPSLDACVSCGLLAGPEIRFGYRLGQGGIVCERCLGDDAETRRIQSGTLAILQRLLEGDDAGWSRLSVAPPQWAEIRSIINPAIAVPLGKRPKMLSYLKFPASAPTDSGR